MQPQICGGEEEPVDWRKESQKKKKKKKKNCKTFLLCAISQRHVIQLHVVKHKGMLSHQQRI
jgi:hypothetical protein